MKRRFIKNATRAGKSALSLLRNTDNLIHMFGETVGKQIAKEWSPCCGLCRLQGYFVDDNGKPVNFNGDTIALAELMSVDLGEDYIVYIYKSGNFVVLGTESTRQNKECTPEHIADISISEEAFSVDSNNVLRANPLRFGDVEKICDCEECDPCVSENLATADFVYQPFTLNIWGFDFLDNPALIPSQNDFDTFDATELIATNFVAQRNTWDGYQNNLAGVNKVGSLVPAFQPTPENAPYSLSNYHYLNVGQNGTDFNVGWTKIEKYNVGCTCNRLNVLDQSPNGLLYDYQVEYLEPISVPDPIEDVTAEDFPSTGKFGQIIRVNTPTTLAEFYWNSSDPPCRPSQEPPNEDCRGNWCADYGCAGASSPDPDDCRGEISPVDNTISAELTVFSQANKVFTWFGVYIPSFQIKKYKI